MHRRKLNLRPRPKKSSSDRSWSGSRWVFAGPHPVLGSSQSRCQRVRQKPREPAHIGQCGLFNRPIPFLGFAFFSYDISVQTQSVGSLWDEGRKVRSKRERNMDTSSKTENETETPIDDEEVEMIGDLGSEEDDPEGWMSERARYWTDLALAVHPTRTAFLLHRMAECMGWLRALVHEKISEPQSDRVPDSTWSKLADEVFGYSTAESCQQLPHVLSKGMDASNRPPVIEHALRKKPWLLRTAAAPKTARQENCEVNSEWPPRPSRPSDRLL